MELLRVRRTQNVWNKERSIPKIKTPNAQARGKLNPERAADAKLIEEGK